VQSCKKVTHAYFDIEKRRIIHFVKILEKVSPDKTGKKRKWKDIVHAIAIRHPGPPTKLG
jgi:hypothetical protein